MFRQVTNLGELKSFIVVQSNLYASQNGGQFQTNVKEMMALSGINSIMGIIQLPTVQNY